MFGGSIPMTRGATESSCWRERRRRHAADEAAVLDVIRAAMATYSEWRPGWSFCRVKWRFVSALAGGQMTRHRNAL